MHVIERQPRTKPRDKRGFAVTEEPAMTKQPSIQGLRVAVVEDEAAIAMMIEMMLEDMGCVLAGSAASLPEAESLAAAGGFNFMLLDVNLRGHKTDRVAKLLVEKGVRFAFSSGYGKAGLPENFKDRPVIQKPFAAADLEKTFAAHRFKLRKSGPSPQLEPQACELMHRVGRSILLRHHQHALRRWVRRRMASIFENAEAHTQKENQQDCERHTHAPVTAGGCSGCSQG